MRLPHRGRTVLEIRWRLDAEPSYFDDVADEAERCVHACLHTAEGDYEHYSKKILKICKNKPVSLEVFADNFSEMKDQGYVINSWAKNVYGVIWRQPLRHSWKLVMPPRTRC